MVGAAEGGSPDENQAGCPIQAARAQIRDHQYRRYTIRSLNCPIGPAGVWELKEKSRPLDEVGSGVKNKALICAGVKAIRQRAIVNGKKEPALLHQLDLVGAKVRAILGISTLAERHRIQDVAASLADPKIRVIAYFSDLYVKSGGYVNMGTNAFVVFHLYEHGKPCDTRGEEAIMKNWRATKLRV